MLPVKKENKELTKQQLQFISALFGEAQGNPKRAAEIAGYAPTSYPNVTLDELQNHKIRMVIYANQSLRAAHWAMNEHLKKLSTAESLSDVKTEMTTMEDIFHIQEMYEIKKQETEIENNLKKLGYIN